MNHEEVTPDQNEDIQERSTRTRPRSGLGVIDHSSVPSTRNVKPRRVSGYQTVKRKVPKMGRNTLCPCGSGKKIKKCGCKFAPLCM